MAYDNEKIGKLSLDAIMRPAQTVDSREQKVPTIQKDEFKSLDDRMLDTYLKNIPRNEWIPIAKALLIGFGGAALSSLSFLLGRYAQWLRERSGDSVKAMDDSTSSNIGAMVGKGISKVIKVPETAVKATASLGKYVKDAITGLGKHKSKIETVLDKAKNVFESFRKFRREG